jgi:cell division protein FtsQ
MFIFAAKKKPKRFSARRGRPTSRWRSNLFRVDRKKAYRGMLISLAICAVLVCGKFIYEGLCRSVFFRLTGVTVQGCGHLSKDSVVELCGVKNNENLLSMNIATITQNLTSNTWIDEAVVTRDWPNQLLIDIKERKPVAIANRGNEFHYLDKNGRTFAEVIPGDDIDFPVISWPQKVANNSTYDMILATAIDFLKLAGKGNSILPCQNISEIQITEEGEIVLFLLDNVFPIYLGTEDIKQTYSRLAKILKELYKNQEIAKVAFIRMDYMRNKALVSMTESGAHATRS